MSASRFVLALSFAAALGGASLVSAPAQAGAFSCGNESHQNDCNYGTNLYPCCPNGGNCTWWAWESMCRNWHQAPLVNWQNANKWAAHADVDPNYDVVGSPVVGSVATSTLGNFGHVAWVTSSSGGIVYVTEENCCVGCGYGERSAKYPLSKFNSGYVIRHVNCECSPGQTDKKACACGTQSRTCEASCKWGGWDECAGTPEICDGVDNDCNGVVDDGNPPLGDVHPDYAASLVDVSFPQSLALGVHATVWADFRNDGTKAWPSGGVWLVADGAQGNATADGGAPAPKASALFSEGFWRAWNVPVALGAAVAPGEVARFAFDVVVSTQSPAGSQSLVGTQIQETFELQLPDGAPIRCPESAISPAIWVLPAPIVADGGNGEGGGNAAADPGESAGCSVEAASRSTSPSNLVIASALAMMLGLRRRRNALRRNGG